MFLCLQIDNINVVHIEQSLKKCLQTFCPVCQITNTVYVTVHMLSAYNWGRTKYSVVLNVSFIINYLSVIILCAGAFETSCIKSNTLPEIFSEANNEWKLVGDSQYCIMQWNPANGFPLAFFYY